MDITNLLDLEMAYKYFHNPPFPQRKAKTNYQYKSI